MLYGSATFVGAFLLFLIQPLLARIILPWFGGGAAVWSVCLLFYQAILLLGYAYTHWTTRRLSPRVQATFHVMLLVAALGAAFMALPPSSSWKPSADREPTAQLLILLGVTIGLPYLTLSATGPLVQRWFSLQSPESSPYRLYALSNAGSLLALLSYPFVFERYLSLDWQTAAWCGGYLLFACLCGAVAWRARSARTNLDDATLSAGSSNTGSPPVLTKPKQSEVLSWLCLSACGSGLLLATTNQLCSEVAVVPFLLVLPLVIYLVTFIICFERSAWYHRGVFLVVLAVSLMAASAVYRGGLDGGEIVLRQTAVGRWLAQLPAFATSGWLELRISSFIKQLVACSLALFAGCMVCHGELVRQKPAAQHLTLFYVVISAGGALGGLFVALIAPRIFRDYWEYPLFLVLTPLLAALVLIAEWRRKAGHVARASTRARIGAMAALASTLGLFVLVLATVLPRVRLEVRSGNSVRSLYGVLRVEHVNGHEPEQRGSLLWHGQVIHGFQYEAPERRTWPTTYYSAESGVGLAVSAHPKRLAGKPLSIAVIGLGVGTLASYARAGDRITFYELNPDVLAIARDQFTYLSDAEARGATVKVLLGDARVTMEQQLERAEMQELDVLAVDAFSGEAIPIHLLTHECAALYFRHLSPHGILAIHTSNYHIDLLPVVRGLAGYLDSRALFVASRHDDSRRVRSSDWVLITTNPAFRNNPLVMQATNGWPNQHAAAIQWTDDFNSLYEVLR